MVFFCIVIHPGETLFHNRFAWITENLSRDECKAKLYEITRFRWMLFKIIVLCCYLRLIVLFWKACRHCFRWFCVTLHISCQESHRVAYVRIDEYAAMLQERKWCKQKKASVKWVRVVFINLVTGIFDVQIQKFNNFAISCASPQFCTTSALQVNYGLLHNTVSIGHIK